MTDELEIMTVETQFTLASPSFEFNVPSPSFIFTVGPQGPPGAKGVDGTNGILYFEPMTNIAGFVWSISRDPVGAVLIIDQGTIQRPGIDYLQSGRNFTFTFVPSEPYAYYPQ